MAGRGENEDSNKKHDSMHSACADELGGPSVASGAGVGEARIYRVPAEPQRASAGRMRCVLFYSGRKIVQQRSEERSEDGTEKEGGKSYGKKAKGTVQTRHCSALEGTKEKWTEKSLRGKN